MLTYKDSGVDVKEGYNAVNAYKAHAERTKIAGLLTGLGSFNGMFEVPPGMKNPVLLSGADGVGTKLDIACKLKKYDTVGIDCVAMCVNDILCSGAQTAFFLDYIACGHLDAGAAAEIVKGVADGCVEAGCALLGGETAEMPGFYDEGKYDLAGFAVGIAEKEDIVTGFAAAAGDVLVGLSSSGAHSNGYSLIRKLVRDFNVPFGTEGKTIGEELLTPTRIYVRPVMKVLQSFKKSVHAMAHITGGGFYENVPRMFANQTGKSASRLCAVIRKDSWTRPRIFDELIRLGADENDAWGTFNMGIGFVLAVEKRDAEAIIKMFNEEGEASARNFAANGCAKMKAYEIGFLEERGEDCALNADAGAAVKLI